MTTTKDAITAQRELAAPETKKKEICFVRVMFVMTDESVALRVKQAISTAIQDIEGASLDFRIANNMGAMMRG